MNETLALLTQRNSAPRLVEPAPSGEALELMWKAALRAPDHAWLTPWRFLCVTGEARNRLGDVFARAALRRDPDLSEDLVEKARSQPLRAPLIVVVIARLQDHPKVPEQEQLLSAGCAAQGILLAAEAQGYAGIWRTGNNAYDPAIAAELGLADNERIVAYLYIGSRGGQPKALPERSIDQFVTEWPAGAEE